MYPTCIMVNNYKKGNASKIEHYLSLYDAVRHEISFTAFNLDEDKNTIVFPAGINFDLLKSELIKSVQEEIVVEDHRNEIRFRNFYHKPLLNIKYQPRDDNQKNAINFLKNIDNQFDNSGVQKLLCLPTGKGKTYCTINYLNNSQRTPIIFLDRKGLAAQWKDKILEYLDILPENVYIISGQKSIEELLKKTDEEIKDIHYFIALHKTIQTYIKKDNSLQKLLDKLNISIKVFDEAHMQYRDIANIDMSTKDPSIYLTATPQRSEYKENFVYSNMFYKTPKFEIKESSLNRYQNVILVHFSSLPIDEDKIAFEKASSRGYGFNANEYNNYILEKRPDLYYSVISDILFKAILDNGNIDRKTAVVVKNKSMIEFLENKINESLKELNIKRSVSKYYSDTPKAERAKSLDSDIIITTNSMFGKGEDVKGLQAVISTINTSSIPSTTQLLGRLRYIDKDHPVFYFDLIDNGFSKAKNQLPYRMKVYRKFARKIYKFEIDKDLTDYEKEKDIHNEDEK